MLKADLPNKRKKGYKKFYFCIVIQVWGEILTIYKKASLCLVTYTAERLVELL